MAYNKNPLAPEYERTRWPAPDSNELLPTGVIYTAYNEVLFELLKLEDSIESTMELLRGYQQQYPNAFYESTYHFRLPAKAGTVKVYRNGIELTLSEHYTVNINSRAINIFVSPPGNAPVGILSCSYVPLDEDKRYPIISPNEMRNYGVIMRRVTTENLYDIITQTRRSIEEMWKFLKKIPRTWTGGSFNQSMGFNNLLKFNTPISNQHLIQIGEELLAINDYLGIEFGASIGLTVRNDYKPDEYIDENLLRNIMVDTNELELLINVIMQDAIENNITYILERLDI
jgi:hypothetical protein